MIGSNPIEVNGTVSAQCNLTTNPQNTDHPYWQETFFTFWWKDDRNGTFVPVCRIKFFNDQENPTECLEMDHYPAFDVVEDQTTNYIKTIKVDNISYISEVRCSLSIPKDDTSYSESITIDVIGKFPNIHCHF